MAKENTMSIKEKDSARKAFESLVAVRDYWAAKAKTGDINAMRKAIACDSDLVAMKRIANRFDEGWYAGSDKE